MLRQKTIFVLLLIIFLSGCNTPETHVERCVISIQNQTCFCHKYEINKDYIGKIGDTYEVDYYHCDKLVGFTPDNWTELRLYLGDVQRYFKNVKN